METASPGPTSPGRPAAREPIRPGATAAMAHVSLIILNAPDTPADDPRIDAWREALEAAGHAVEVVFPGREAGLTAQAIDGLREAHGEIRVVIDALRHYAAAD